jgi:hypothetical protein
VFWYPGEKPLYLRVNKQTATLAEKLHDVSEIDGPALVFIQAAMEPEAVPVDIQTDYIGGNHTPAFFDDKEHFKEFYLAFEEGYGVVLSKQYVHSTRREYQKFLEKHGLPLPEATSPAPTESREIDTVVLDLDGTAALFDQPLSGNIHKRILSLLEKGRKVVFITEDIEKNVDNRAVALVPLKDRKNLVIFSDGGTRGYTFNEEATKTYFEEYNQKSILSAEFKGRILALLEGHFKGTYELDQRPNRVSPEYRIDLHRVKERDSWINKAASLLAQEGIRAKIYKVGKTSVKVVLQHKEDALRYWMNKHNADENKTLIIADSARLNQADRRLLSGFTHAVSINVGRPSQTIGQTNPNVVQFPAEGVKGTERILTFLDTRGSLPASILRGFTVRSSKEAHLQGYSNGSKSNRRSELRQQVMRSVILATAPEEIKEQIRERIEFLPGEVLDEASHLLIEIAGAEGLEAIQQNVVQEIEIFLKNQKKRDGVSPEEERIAVQRFQGILQQAFRILIEKAKKSGNPKIYLAIDLPKKDEWRGGMEKDFDEALALFRPLLVNLIFSSSKEGRIQFSPEIRKILEKHQFKTPVSDPDLKSAESHIKMEGQQWLGIVTMTQAGLHFGKLSPHFIAIKHRGRFEDLGTFEKKALIMTKFFLGIAVGLEKEPAALLKQYPELFQFFGNSTFRFEADGITVSLERFKAELYAAQRIDSAA